MVDHHIFHYEDEPRRVDLPGLLEIALYQSPRVAKSSIEQTSDFQVHTIRYRVNLEDHVLRYVIEESIAAAELRSGIGADQAEFHLVDLHIGENHEAGISIVSELQAKQVSNERIWMVTAYEGIARLDQRLSGIAIYPKPSPLSQMVELILPQILGDS